MNKFKKKFWDFVQKTSAENEGALFTFITIMCFLAIVIATILTIVEHSGLISSMVTTIGDTIVLIVFFLGRKTKKYQFFSFILMMVVNMLIMPLAFVTSGSYLSGMPSWCILCMVIMFYLLRGRYLVIAVICTSLADAVCFLFSYYFPAKVAFLPDDEATFVDIFIASSIVCFLLCFFMKIQANLYEKERAINKKQQEQLEQALRSKSLFLANMSHEIRTPINTIIGLNEMTLRERDINQEVRENSANIQRASKMLLSIINDVLDLSKIEAGHMEVVCSEYSTGDMFSDIVNTNWIRAQKKNLELQISISPSLPVELYGDDSKIKQIVTNLLSNAIKYTKEGSVTLYVDCERKDEKNVLMKFDVVDTGMGIRQEDMQDLFKDFQRVNEKNTKGIEGTGLGLPICKKLVDLMGGTISVDSIYRKGSTFSVVIPQEIVDPKEIGEWKRNGLQTQRFDYEKSFEAPEAAVLVVDDNEMNRLVVKKLLRDTRVQLDEAKSGEECLRMTAEKVYDVILMDHLMPEMDGEETLKKVRDQKNGCCLTTPVIALTANAMAGATELYRKMGFNDYLSKPINGEVLERTLLEYLPPDKIENQVREKQNQDSDGFTLTNRMRKKKILIAVDNACDLTEDIVKQLGIMVMNHYIIVDGCKFKDNKEIFAENVLEDMAAGKRVSSQPPEQDEYENFFATALERAEQVIYLAVSSKLYKGYEVACNAAKSFSHVTVYDSMNLSSALGIMAMEAAKMAIDERSIEDILTHMDDLREHVVTTFILDKGKEFYHDTKFAHALYNFSQMFQIHVMMGIANGKLVFKGTLNGDVDECYQKFVHKLLKRKKKIDQQLIFFTYSNCSAENIEIVKKGIDKYQHFEQVYENHTSASISGYCGNGCIALFFVEK